MNQAIGAIGQQVGVQSRFTLDAAQQAIAPGQTSFKDLLVDSVNQVNAMQQDANAAVENLMTGGDVNPAEVLSAVQKADLAFRMTMQVRNKLMQAYEEVKSIRV
ncbi:MAG: flagellar hook-basal body complex protein FliE [Pirellulales bacterium]|nr:flagellar hook-basal body complex protein FliE [Pirellulales bacterium]